MLKIHWRGRNWSRLLNRLNDGLLVEHRGRWWCWCSNDDWLWWWWWWWLGRLWCLHNVFWLRLFWLLWCYNILRLLLGRRLGSVHNLRLLWWCLSRLCHYNLRLLILRSTHSPRHWCYYYLRSRLLCRLLLLIDSVNALSRGSHWDAFVLLRLTSITVIANF